MPYRAWSVSRYGSTVAAVSDRAASDPRLKVFGARLRQAREARGLTMEQLAEAAGVGVRQIARVEGGRGSPSVVWLLDVSQGLGLPVGELFEPS